MLIKHRTLLGSFSSLVQDADAMIGAPCRFVALSVRQGLADSLAWTLEVLLGLIRDGELGPPFAC